MAAHEFLKTRDPALGVRATQSEISKQALTKAAAQKKQRTVPGHHADKSDSDCDWKSREAAMRQKSAGQQSHIFWKWQPQSTQHQHDQQSQIREVLKIIGEQAYQFV